jgi:hypothetical protein
MERFLLNAVKQHLYKSPKIASEISKFGTFPQKRKYFSIYGHPSLIWDLVATFVKPDVDYMNMTLQLGNV